MLNADNAIILLGNIACAGVTEMEREALAIAVKAIEYKEERETEEMGVKVA